MLSSVLVLASVFTLQASNPHHGAHPAPAAAESNAAVDDMHASMMKMHDGMKNFEVSGNADVDFMRMMIPHHQGAIDMVQAYLKHGKDPKVRAMAQKMADEQTKEIADMKAKIEAFTAKPAAKKKK